MQHVARTPHTHPGLVLSDTLGLTNAENELEHLGARIVGNI